MVVNQETVFVIVIRSCEDLCQNGSIATLEEQFNLKKDLVSTLITQTAECLTERDQMRSGVILCMLKSQ